MLSLTALLRARAAPTAAALAAGRAPCAAGLLRARCRSSAAGAAPAADDEVFPGAGVDLPQPPMHESGSHDAFFLPQLGGVDNFFAWHKLGETVKVRLHCIGGDTVFHGNPVSARKALQAATDRGKIPHFTLWAQQVTRDPSADSTVAATGEHWKVMRDPYNKLMMRGRNVEKMMPLINEQAQVMVNKWRDNEPKTFQVDLRDPLMGYVNKVIGVAAFGRDFLEDDGHEYPVAQAALDMVRGLGYIMGQPMAETDEKGFLQLGAPEGDVGTANAFRAFDRMGEFCSKVVKNRLAQIEKEGLDAVAEKNLDFLSKLFGEKDLPMVGKVMIANELLGAGTDTTTSSSAFLSYELAINPEVRHKLAEEVRSVCGTDPNEDITVEMVMKMPYLNACINEGMRRWPAIPWNGGRMINKEMTFEVRDADGNTREVTAPPGAVHGVNLWAFQMDPKNFSDPEKFIPERFLGDETSKNMAMLMPFGEGARACPGQKLARLELKVLFAQMLKSFDFDWAYDGVPEYEFALTLNPTTPILVNMTRVN